MKKLVVLLIASFSCACAARSSVVVTPQPPTSLSVSVIAQDQNGVGILGAAVSVGAQQGVTNADGWMTFHDVPACREDACRPNVHAEAPNCGAWDGLFQTWAGMPDFVVKLDCVAPHVDAAAVPLETLARIRGAMWTERLDLPFGPRPGQADNILATDFIACYTPADRQRAIDKLKAGGYTHVVMGPLVDSDGYHGQYCTHDWRQEWDFFLDLAELFWDNGLVPVVFIHPDGWDFAQTRDELTPLLRQERAQKLLRVVVPSGWEPTRYGWSSCTWSDYAKWARQTLPNALVLIHTVHDVDAPVGGDAQCNDDGHPNADGWARVAPFIHGWLVQNGPYQTAPDQDPGLREAFMNQFRPAARGSLWQRFHEGYAGWPRSSAWGPDQPIRIYNAEVTSYQAYWYNFPEAASRAWGDAAIAAGADGYLDGGSVDVPTR